MQTLENSSTGHETIEPRNDTTRSAPFSVAAVIELAMWLVPPYIAIGAAWAFIHPERLHELELGWDKVIPASADVVAFGEAMALWPAFLLIPTGCSAD